MTVHYPFGPGGRGPRRRWTRPQDFGHDPGKARRGWGAGFVGALVVLPALAFTTALLWDDPAASEVVPPAGAPRLTTILEPSPSLADTESARFVICGGRARVNCVVDGDTFWYRGAKYRVADINTPEVSEPQCDREAALGAAATDRLHALLNQGAFTLQTTGRDQDQYGRLLRVVTRGGESLGGVLVREGLAEEWRGYRGSWC